MLKDRYMDMDEALFPYTADKVGAAVTLIVQPQLKHTTTS